LVVDTGARAGRAETPPGPARIAVAEVEVGTAAATTSVSGFYQEKPPRRGELRLDVDGPDALRMVSGVIVGGLTSRLHWIARLAPVGAAGNRWGGSIWYKEGTAALLPHNSVDVRIANAAAGAQEATVRFSGGAPGTTRVFRRKSAAFHPVEFEFDVVEGTTAVTSIETCAHPNRPPGLPCETLTIETAFRRAGFDVSLTSAGPRVPLARAGADAVWSDTEMHDAMQTYWSRFAGTAQWSLWVLFAARHEDTPEGPGFNLGGIMFDDIGPNHRQGTAIFNDTFIAQAPAGDAAPDAWVRRMRFWTAVHEMGHAFNLAHSWQKSLGESWIPLTNQPQVRSFMNYPFRVAGGQRAFFSDFAFRFSQEELLFMRHAPERFVQMGNARWFDDHAFRHAEISLEPKLRLELRVNRPKAVFDFLEPCMLELKLANISDEPQLVGEQVLADADHLLVVIKKDRGEARQWLPFAQYCRKARRMVLAPGEARYQALFVGAGRNGWDLAEPGLYTVQVALRYGEEDIVSNPLRIQITPPRQYEDERIAQDFLTDDVGRVLAFDGSRVLASANDVLRETAERLPDRAVARHALVALSRPLMHEGKVLDLPAQGGMPMESAADGGGAIALAKAEPDAARAGLQAALMTEPGRAARTLGHIEYKQYADQFSDDLAAAGDRKAAAGVQSELRDTLAARNVKPFVLAQVEEKLASFTA
jgi:hypothetical protein